MWFGKLAPKDEVKGRSNVVEKENGSGRNVGQLLRYGRLILKEQRGNQTKIPCPIYKQERSDVKERTGRRDSGMSIPKERDC